MVAILHKRSRDGGGLSDRAVVVVRPVVWLRWLWWLRWQVDSGVVHHIRLLRWMVLELGFL